MDLLRKSGAAALMISVSMIPPPIVTAAAIQQAALRIMVIGLPSSAVAAVDVSGPNGFSRTLNVKDGTTRILPGLTPGTYTVLAPATFNTVVGGAPAVYMRLPGHTSVSIAAGQTAPVAVTYRAALGGLRIRLSGLPASSSAQVTVTGANAFSRTLSVKDGTTRILSGLAPGTYTVLAPATFNTVVGGAPAVYMRLSGSTSVSIAAGRTATVTVTYQATSR